MRKWIILLAGVALVSAGCGTSSGGGATSGNDTKEVSIDGLERVVSDESGDLYLRKDHGIGGYDAIVVASAFMTYRRSSSRLDENLEDAYLGSLEQAIIDVADEANVPIVAMPEECAIKIGVGFVNLDLARSDRADVLARMTLVIEYQDSVSGQSLLRFMAPKRVDRTDDGRSRDQQIRASFDRMIEEVDMINALRKATIVPSEPRPGCEGRLLRAGLPAE